MKNKKHYVIMIIILLAIILLDQIIKIVVIRQNETITILEGILEINYNENKGIAFGIGNKNLVSLIVTDILVISILFRFLIKQIDNMNGIARISLFFIIAGGISNLIDRLVRGKVIDYIDISQMISGFPIFNIADVSIIIGFVSFVIIVGIDLIKMRPRELGGK